MDNFSGFVELSFPPLFLGQVQNWVTWGQKLGHQAKSKEDLVNALEVTFLKRSS